VCKGLSQVDVRGCSMGVVCVFASEEGINPAVT
jgi:hypothetical protein